MKVLKRCGPAPTLERKRTILGLRPGGRLRLQEALLHHGSIPSVCLDQLEETRFPVDVCVRGGPPSKLPEVDQEVLNV
ncbi:MAG: hypothetical protein ACRENX_02845 [Candidatus Dormibacteria bacterium]